MALELSDYYVEVLHYFVEAADQNRSTIMYARKSRSLPNLSNDRKRTDSGALCAARHF